MKQALIISSILILISCEQKPKSDSPSSTIDEAKTKEIFDRHFKAFFANDLDGIMVDYTDESILITPKQTRVGLAEIRKGFEGVFKAFPKDSTTSEIINKTIKNDMAYIIWKVKGPKTELTFATDSFIIQNGKIVRQTFAGH
jgi:hypothetical protein